MNQATLYSYIEHLCNQTAWSPWQLLEGSWLESRLPKRSGIYRIRLAGASDLIYVGETGRKEETLKTRLGALRDAYNEERMPYRSPHTAGPYLWALRKTTRAPLEVSIISLGPEKATPREKGKELAHLNAEEPLQQEATAPILDEVEEPMRKGLEALVIALHRQQFGRSPAAQYGRMLVGWRASSSNTTRLAARGLRSRGYPTSLLDESHVPGIPPIATLAADGNPSSRQWGGHVWSPWCPPSLTTVPEDAVGLYRLRHPNARELLYIGRGQISDRLREYTQGNIECSWVRGSWLYHQQIELLTDLLASYLLSCLSLPPTQFGASKQDRILRMKQPISPERVWWSVMLDTLRHELLPMAG